MVRYRTPLTTRQVDIPPSHPASGHKLLKFPTRNQYILEVRTQNPLVIQAEGEYLRVDSAVTCPYSPVFRHSIESMPPYLLFTAACRGLEVNDAAQDLYHLFRFMFEGHYRPQTADESLITLDYYWLQSDICFRLTNALCALRKQQDYSIILDTLIFTLFLCCATRPHQDIYTGHG
ncbi:unnamed protein product [Somion occarium]|uniref:BTB domain-containing protein n=1 Tax=Somion occarium TaxID=3059160 RepID=A0ABP1DH64_9APHY